MSIEKLKEKCKKQIVAVIIIGMMLIITDVIISYSNNGIEIVSSNGQLYMTRPDLQMGMGHINFKVKVCDEKEIFEKKVAIALEPYGKKDGKEKEERSRIKEIDERERVENELRSIVSGFNDNSNDKKVKLPLTLRSGEKISWERERTSNVAAISMVTMLAIILIYKNRFAPLDKKVREERNSVIRQLPEFVNRLVLLLNAGLVLNSAFEKTVEESMLFKSRENDYFYSKMKEIHRIVKSANGSMYIEFRNFAKESSIKELIRISNIISDNVNKGVELTSKLQAESEILWISRKKSCEERGYVAETKLTLPLMIFLMVLIVITIAPAMLEL